MSGKHLVVVPGFSMRALEKQLGGLPLIFSKNNINFDIIDYLKKPRVEKSIIGWNLAKAVEVAKTIIEAKKLRGKRNAFVYSYGLPVVSKLSKELNFDTMVVYAPVFGPGTIRWKWYQKIFLKLPRLFPGFAEMESKKLWEEIFANLSRLKQEGIKIIFLIPPEKNGSHQDEKVKYTKEDIERMKIFGEVRKLPEPTHYIEGQNLKEVEKCILKAFKPSFF